MLPLGAGAIPPAIGDVLTQGRTVVSEGLVKTTDGNNAYRYEVRPPIKGSEIPGLAQQLAANACGNCVLIAPKYR